jgi:hypothetical protein
MWKNLIGNESPRMTGTMNLLAIIINVGIRTTRPLYQLGPYKLGPPVVTSFDVLN